MRTCFWGRRRPLLLDLLLEQLEARLQRQLLRTLAVLRDLPVRRVGRRPRRRRSRRLIVGVPRGLLFDDVVTGLAAKRLLVRSGGLLGRPLRSRPSQRRLRRDLRFLVMRGEKEKRG